MAFEELKSILITERNKRVRASLGIMVDTLLKDAQARNQDAERQRDRRSG